MSALSRFRGAAATEDKVTRTIGVRGVVRSSTVDTSRPDFPRYNLMLHVLEIFGNPGMLCSKKPITQIPGGFRVQRPTTSAAKLAKFYARFHQPAAWTEEQYTAAVAAAFDGPVDILVGNTYLFRPAGEAARANFPAANTIVTLRDVAVEAYVKVVKDGADEPTLEPGFALTYGQPADDVADAGIAPVQLVPAGADVLPAELTDLYRNVRAALVEAMGGGDMPESLEDVIRVGEGLIGAEAIEAVVNKACAAARDNAADAWGKYSGDSDKYHNVAVAIHVPADAAAARWRMVDAPSANTYPSGKVVLALNMHTAPVPGRGPTELVNAIHWNGFDGPQNLFGVRDARLWDMMQFYIVHAPVAKSFRGFVNLVASATSGPLMCDLKQLALDWRALAQTYGVATPAELAAARLARFPPAPAAGAGADAADAARHKLALAAMHRIAAESGVWLFLPGCQQAAAGAVRDKAGAYVTWLNVVRGMVGKAAQPYKVAADAAVPWLFDELAKLAAASRADAGLWGEDGTFDASPHGMLLDGDMLPGEKAGTHTSLMAFVEAKPPEFPESLTSAIHMQWTSTGSVRPRTSKRARDAN